jgi:hypothetical protein
MARSIKRRSFKNKRGGAYGSGSLGTSGAPVNRQRGGSKRQSRKNRRQTLTRKQKRSRKQRKSFLSTLNQMGGYIRDGSTQFFKRLQGEQ